MENSYFNKCKATLTGDALKNQQFIIIMTIIKPRFKNIFLVKSSNLKDKLRNVPELVFRIICS